MSATLPPPKPIAAVGFHAELSGASLWDLVQLECLARSRQVVQVSGEGGTGYLYFAGGRVIHAVTARQSGQAAALEILAWTQGSFQGCERVWPATPTIQVSHETLILLAAKRRDEAAAATNLVAFRGRAERDPQGEAEVVTDEVTDDAIISQEEVTGGTDMAETRGPRNATGPGSSGANSLARGDALPDFSMMIRVAPGGAIVNSKGGSEEVAAAVAYTQRLVELVGDLLGLDRFVAMECTFKDEPGAQPAGQSRCLLFTEANGDTVALRPRPDSSMQSLRESLGL